MKTRKKLWIFLLSLFCLVLGGCGAQEGETEAEAPGVSWESLSFPQELEILYATQFSAASSPEGYTKISIEDGLSYLVVPEGAAAPAALDADIVCLIKPQFEAGREEVGKKGVVRDSAVHKEVIRSVLDFAPGIGLTPVGLDFSPIKGPEGNIEYICHLKNGDFAAPQLDVDAVVAASHEAL